VLLLSISGCLLEYDLGDKEEDSGDTGSALDSESSSDTGSDRESCVYRCVSRKTCESLSGAKIHQDLDCKKSKQVCCESENGTEIEPDTETETTSDTATDTDTVVYNGCGTDGDSDSDGVCDPSDQCAGDDSSGDTDGDGVCDGNPAGWTVMNDMPYAGGGLASAVLSDGLHILGGSKDWNGSQTYRYHYVYNGSDDTWSSSPAEVPDSNTWGAQAQVHDNRLYLVGGWDNGGFSLRVYDPNLDIWDILPNIPAEYEYGFVSAVVGDDLFVIGGYPGVHSDAPVYKLNLITEVWSACANLPHNEGWGSLAGAPLGEKIYVLNGDISGGGTILQIYDTRSDSWSRGAELAVHHEAASSLVFEDKIYFFGGARDQDADAPAVQRAVNIYDPENDAWSRGHDMPAAHDFSTAQLLNGHFHVLGGLGSDFKGMSHHHVFISQ